MTLAKEKTNIILILKISCLCLLFGRAWQHLFWHTPHSEVFWSEAWWGGLVESWGLTWNDYANNYMNYKLIEGIVVSIGLLYFITAILVIFYKKGHKLTAVLLWLSSFNLVFLAFCYMKDKSFAVAQFWEYTIQFLLPILLWLWVEQKITVSKWLILTKIAIALTFLAHGLYALGFYPVPGNFIDMLIAIFGMQQKYTYPILTIAGILDMIIAVGIFAPNFKVVKYLLIYATFWGTATALARIAANVSSVNFINSILESAPHTIYRLPHGLLPLVALLVIVFFQQKPSNNKILVE